MAVPFLCPEVSDLSKQKEGKVPILRKSVFLYTVSLLKFSNEKKNVKFLIITKLCFWDCVGISSAHICLDNLELLFVFLKNRYTFE